MTKKPSKQREMVQKPLSTLRFNSSITPCPSDADLDEDGQNGHTATTTKPLVSFVAAPKGPKCPFGNKEVTLDLYPGGCVWLAGRSGLGKTTLSTYLAGLSTLSDLNTLDIECRQCDWHPRIHPSERCGVLFQQTTLLDALTVAGNICVALQSCPSFLANKKYPTLESQTAKIKQIMEAVGLNYARDAGKRPTELSGGMARRASLALQLAQRKRVIALDEPFTGLDWETSRSVCKEILHLRKDLNCSILLITHEPELAQIVLDEANTNHNYKVELTVPTKDTSKEENASAASVNNMLFGITWWDRFQEKLFDYVLYSLPLISLTFVACGLAISMLSADILQRIDVTDQVVGIVDQELRPLIKMVTGEEEANPMYLMVAKMKVKSMLNTVVPEAKAKLYAIGMAKLFVLEIGPLMTALLLSGRIGGSYAGKVATMQATSQTKLLRTLGINPQTWTFLPAIAAALIAAPVLTMIGTGIALFLGGRVGPRYGIGTYEMYQNEIHSAIFPDLALEAARNETWFAFLVELSTYPPVFHLWKATTFMTIIMFVAEIAARRKPNLSPRGVPGVITSSVVIASLLVIIADWGFSQWWINRL